MHAIAIFDSLLFLAIVDLRQMLFSAFLRIALRLRTATSLLSSVTHTALLMRLLLEKRASQPSGTITLSTINWTSEGFAPSDSGTKDDRAYELIS